jgi:serine/threonine protein phosphatase PrpC
MMRDLALAARQPGPADVCAWLARVDDAILAEGKGGLATAVALILSGTGVVGASVGNSQAWIVADEVTVLTENQHRKPMMGSGDARPVGFSHRPFEGWLLVGTDGLFNYASRPKISRACDGTGAQQVAAALVDAARLADGGLQDDIAVAALRPSPPTGSSARLDSAPRAGRRRRGHAAIRAGPP